ncbi:ABC transporter ATP-binding protein [Evansella clarkii]|uniref:ABC transporter ATP-binding protein n=1 Tax=Evansella clarkii TaxID=79879 RepID=UPI00099685EB|nr:ABC transporter ATP-binding protein [Evansella clarkii]
MIVSVENIYKSYGKVKTLKGVTFQIKEPQILALVGPNGAGKSTLLNIITNITSADSGSVTIFNKSNKDTKIFREISYMQDNSVLYDYLTGYDHLQFIGELHGISKKKIKETAELIGVESYLNNKVNTYSLGMKQHLLLSMAILNEPKLLILDEPLNGLDPTSSIKTRNLILDLYNQGTTILLSSHNLAEIDQVTSNVLFLKAGKLFEEDIGKYKQITYKIKVNDSTKACDLLKNSSIPYLFLDNSIMINKNNASIHELNVLFHRNNITLLDIEKKKHGTEDRYREIFGLNEE